VKRTLKALAGRVAYAIGLYRLFFRNRAVIVLFHRIDDDLAARGDPITCSRETFRRYCAFLKRHFLVVPLSELVERVRRGEDVTRCAAITFDDGYEDNYELAAADLQALGLPACFFVVTDFLDSDRQAPWDEAKGIRSRWMGWDEARALRDQGFELGAHTRTHPDLGIVEGERARDEIAGSKERLERELGAPVTLFSYPFGGRHQLTDANRQLVRDAGFSCCVSAYGGTVSSGADPFDLRRIAVSPWFVSPYHFGLEVMLQGRSNGEGKGGTRGGAGGAGGAEGAGQHGALGADV
jgi:peptidoglycan/xylan/chitin deacetylase (PgdA/CDA1 family)